MKLKDLLLRNRVTLLTRWFEEALRAYPADAQNFFREKMNRFGNPVGSMIGESLEGLYGELLRGWKEEEIFPFLDPLIRMRAVQQLLPSQALSFIPSLKKIVRIELAQEMQRHHLLGEFQDFAAEVDRLTLLSFDLYMGCREKVHEIKIKELKGSSEKIWKKIEKIYG